MVELFLKCTIRWHFKHNVDPLEGGFFRVCKAPPSFFRIILVFFFFDKKKGWENIEKYCSFFSVNWTNLKK